MTAIIGFVVVAGSVLGGFLMSGGNLSVLVHPAELIIIGGAAIGAFFISSPKRVATAVMKNISGVFSSKGMSKENYLELLTLLFQIFAKIRKEGLISIEADIEKPEKSAIFTRYKGIMANHHAVNFICDNLKVIITSNVPAHELDSLMDMEIDTHHHEALIPSHSVAKIADGLPGLGIVAAVLGVVLTMEKIDQPPSVLGSSIGAALVGTFLGVLLCYGFVGPMAANLEHKAQDEGIAFQVIKAALVAFVGGSAPQMAVEFARRAIPGEIKPSFSELEARVRGKGK